MVKGAVIMNELNEKSDIKTKKLIERITIDESLTYKLQNLTQLANESLQGMTTISKSDVINLILKLHEESLSKNEIEELRKAHFDIFKCLTWLQNQAKEAKENGSQVTLHELLSKSSELMAGQKLTHTFKPRKSRAKKQIEKDSPAENEKS